MTSKQTILKAIRAHHVPEAALPALEHSWTCYDDPLRQFQTMVEAVGGRCVPLDSLDQVRVHLMTLETFSTATKVISAVEGVDSSVDIGSGDDPHDLEAVDWAVLPGLLGVAENGAVWVTDEAVRHRALYFIVQHLALVLPAQQIVHNLHEAYVRIAVGTSSLGAFISGPSKTADIEQSLVIGAHGPRSLTVFCVSGWNGVPSISLPA